MINNFLFKKSNSTSSKIILDLIGDTKSRNINWINMQYLKTYLKNDDISLNAVPKLKEFLIYLQGQRFIFDCENTYLTVSENNIYALSKSKYSEEYRLDCYFANESLEAMWERVSLPINWMLRLRNIIEIINDDSDVECSEFISTISQKNFV